jgi:hypothetical protein
MDGTTTFDAVSCLANQDTRERAPGRASPALTLTASGQEKYFPLDAHAPQANPGALSSAHASKRHGRAAEIFGVTKKVFSSTTKFANFDLGVSDWKKKSAVLESSRRVTLKTVIYYSTKNLTVSKIRKRHEEFPILIISVDSLITQLN